MANVVRVSISMDKGFAVKGPGVGITATANTIPIFVRAGPVVPLGAAIESTEEKQAIASVRVYPGADGDFTLYSDDGKTYAYENGKSEVSHLHWSDAAKALRHTGSQAWDAADSAVVEVIGKK